jgi:hypothetical protein
VEAPSPSEALALNLEISEEEASAQAAQSGEAYAPVEEETDDNFMLDPEMELGTDDAEGLSGDDGAVSPDDVVDPAELDIF